MPKGLMLLIAGWLTLALGQPSPAPSVSAVPWAVGGIAQPSLLRLSDLKTLLESKGVKFDQVAVLSRYLLEMQFPQTANALYIRIIDHNNRSYAVFDDIFINLAQLDMGVNVAVRVEGWDTPTITIGSTSFKVGSRDAPVNPYLAYMYLVRKALLGRGDAPPYLSKLLDDNPKARACLHTLRVSDPEGTVYAVASRRWAEINLAAPYDRILGGFPQPSAFDVAPVDGGLVRLHLASSSAQYAPSLQAWQKSKDPNSLLLIKLNGKITDQNAEYQVVVPSGGKTQALNCK
ncbi:MAG: hypothetical protein IVW51_07400 [Thermaceae bacterium]|nr:hypothetical protein [Thermaceae bacterium]